MTCFKRPITPSRVTREPVVRPLSLVRMLLRPLSSGAGAADAPREYKARMASLGNIVVSSLIDV